MRFEREPKKPGRKPGSKYGRQAVRAIPVPDKTFAPCPEQCPCGGKVGAEGEHRSPGRHSAHPTRDLEVRLGVRSSIFKSVKETPTVTLCRQAPADSPTLPQRRTFVHGRCWGKIRGIGVDGWRRRYRPAKSAAPLPGGGRCASHCLVILRHALALRDRRWRDQPAWPARCQGTPPGRTVHPDQRSYRDNLFVFLDRADVEVRHSIAAGPRRRHRAKGAQAQSILMSVLQSCRHKGIRVIDIVTSILRAPDNTPVPLVNPER